VSSFDDLFKSLWGVSALIFVIVAVSVVMSFAQSLLQILAWIISLDVPDTLKLWVTEHIFAAILAMVAAIAGIAAKIRRG
jgi:hypothetical protein